MEEQVTVASHPKWIGICMSQAHTFLKDDFLCVLEREARKAYYNARAELTARVSFSRRTRISSTASSRSSRV